MTILLKSLFLRIAAFMGTLVIAGCASIPSEIASERKITVVYRQAAIPTLVYLLPGGTPFGIVGAWMDEATAEKNIANRARADEINGLAESAPLLNLFKNEFKQALFGKDLETLEIPSTGGARLDLRTHIPSFDRDTVRTRWVIQIDEVQTRYSASNAFVSYKPWVFVKFAIFDMQDKSLAPIVPITPSTIGSDAKYHFQNSEALAGANTRDLLIGLQLAVRQAALDTAQKIRP